MEEDTIFFSYSPEDSEFVFSLAKSLREAGAKVWMDQLDIKPGNRRDESVESALKSSNTLLVVLSQDSVKSDKVMDEVSYALEENKKVVPLLLEECNIPFRIRRLQYATFTEGNKIGIESLISALQLDDQVANKLAQDANLSFKPKPKPINDFKEQEAIRPPNNVIPKTPKKSNNTIVYLLIGLSIVIILVALVLLPRNRNSDPGKPVITKPNSNEVIQTDNNQVSNNTNNSAPININSGNTDTTIANDWAKTTNTNTIEAYIQFVSTYGKNNAYYNDAFTRMKNMFSNSGYVKYGIVNVEQYFTKSLYFNGTELTIPEKGDFISPKMTNEIWNNNSPTGYYVQPGRFYLVLDVATDINNEVWVHLGI